MNATCSAGILQPQRVSDLGRLLNSEITAPLVFNTSMAPASLHGASTCMAPASLHGAFIYMAPFSLQGALHHWGVLSAKRPHHWRLPICMAPSPTSARRLSIYKGAHTSPCARQLIIPTRGSVCPPTSKVAISSLSSVSKETWLSLISPLEMAQRRRSFPSPFTSKFSYLLFHPNRSHVTTFQRIRHIRFREQ